MSQRQTGWGELVNALAFAAERVRIGFMAIALILVVKIVGAVWLPDAAPVPAYAAPAARAVLP